MIRTATSGPFPLTYERTGKGKPVMLLHGFGEDGAVWQEMRHDLAQQYTVLIPDFPGSGRTPPFPRDSSPSLDQLATCVRAVWELETQEPMTLLGHSMGGYVALAYAATYPDDLSGLGLIHSTARSDDASKRESRIRSMAFLQQNGSRPFLETAWPTLFANPSEHTNWIMKLSERMSGIPPETLIAYYQAMMSRPDHTPLLPTLKMPLLWIAGVHDVAVPLLQVLEQSYRAPVTHLHVLAHSGHMGFVEQPEPCLRILRDFIGFSAESLRP